MPPKRPIAPPPPPSPEMIQRAIVEILDGNRLMSLATVRPDGWPQATVVSYLRDGPALCFVVGRDSQKYANLSRNRRVAITVLDTAAGATPVRALSMSAEVDEITETPRIARINRLIRSHSAATPFAPHPTSANVALLEARPQVVSLADHGAPPGRRDLVRIVDAWRVEPIANADTPD